MHRDKNVKEQNSSYNQQEGIHRDNEIQWAVNIM